MKYLLIFTSLFFFTFVNSNSQEAVFPVTNYTTKDYGRDFHPTNMSIIQDQRGIIYSANGFKLLEYDGSAWKSFPINKKTWILSLAVGPDGLIYAGSQNEFGFFAPDITGELKYHSLSDSLDINDLDFTNIWEVHTFSGGVVFQAEEKLFLFRNGKVRTLKPETSFHTSFVVNDRLFVRQRGTGLMECVDNQLVKVKGSEIFDTTGVFLMLPFGKKNDKILIGTQEKGFWLFHTEGNSSLFNKFHVNDEKLLQKSIIRGGVVTDDGLIAISTMLNGVILIDTSGNTKAVVNKRKGLSDNDVKHIVLDQGKNLWVALNNGISRIEISSPLSVLNEKSGITGSVNATMRYENRLYTGTNTGLFVQDTSGKPDSDFKEVPGLTVPVRSLINAGGSLLAGTDAGLFQILGNKVQKLDEKESFTLFYSPETRLLLSGGPKGLSTFINDQIFRKIDALSIEGEDIIGISDEKSILGNAFEFWLGTRYNGVIRIRINNDFSFSSDSYTKADGLPDGPVIPSSFNTVAVFETMQGLYSFINENIVKQSVPDSLKNNKDFIKGYFSALRDVPTNKGEAVSVFIESKNKVWLCSNNNVGYFDKKDSMNYVTRPFSGIESGKINAIFPEESGICWIGTTEGLIRYNENTGKDYEHNYITLIRKVTLLDNDSSIFNGTGFNTVDGKIQISNEQALQQIPSLNYRDNSVRFDFSASFYEHPEKIGYSYKLEGRSPKWSQWTPEHYQEFTNLREGHYSFIVKSRNIYGKESSEAIWSFVVLPPWYRSAVSYIAYVIAAFFLLWLFARLYSYRLKRDNLRLEGIVTERTAEVVRQKDEIIDKNIILEYQKKEIEDSIRYAKRIQSAVIPSEHVCRQIFPESFVFFRPLNIVSGDFYWISHAGSKIIFAAADCTGHGVPGAFMCMLGVAFLNEIVNKDNITVPDVILNNLREKVIQALQQQGLSGEARDGMDIALVSIDTQAGKLEYSGAYNPLLMIRNGQVYETPGDKMPIGIYENMHSFRKHEIMIEQGDVFYMFSDGLEDQFGGPEGKKFKAKRLKSILLEICSLPMEKQKEILEKNFEDWKGELPQVDDIVVVGIAIR